MRDRPLADIFFFELWQNVAYQRSTSASQLIPNADTTSNCDEISTTTTTSEENVED